MTSKYRVNKGQVSPVHCQMGDHHHRAFLVAYYPPRKWTNHAFVCVDCPRFQYWTRGRDVGWAPYKYVPKWLWGLAVAYRIEGRP